MIANCVAMTLPVALIRVLERTNDRGAAIAGENVLDNERDGLRQHADIADEIGDRLAAGLAADPGKHPIVALDIEYEIGVKQGCDLGRILATADPFPKASVQWQCSSDELIFCLRYGSVGRFHSPASRTR